VWAVEVHGHRLFSASADKTIRVWDVDSRRCEHVLEDHTRPVLSLAINGNRLYSGSYDFTIKVSWAWQTAAAAANKQQRTNVQHALHMLRTLSAVALPADLSVHHDAAVGATACCSLLVCSLFSLAASGPSTCSPSRLNRCCRLQLCRCASRCGTLPHCHESRRSQATQMQCGR
jgi:hypothetical protein